MSSLNPKKIVPVVAIVLFDQTNRRYFIAKRAQHEVGAGHWEFPGGKVEKGETQKEALKREIKEELNVSIDTEKLDYLTKSQVEYEQRIIDICFYLYTIDGPVQVELTDHDDFLWKTLDELQNQSSLATADIPVIDVLRKMEIRSRK